MEKRIRVLTVIRHPVGGIRTFLKYTYGSLDRKRYHFTIVTVEDVEGRLLEDDLSGFEVQVFRAQGSWRLAAMVRDIFLLCWSRKVDIIHSHGLTAGALAVIGNAVISLPHIITSHDVLRSEYFSGWSGTLKRQILGFLLTRADVIHCVSEDVRRNLLEFLPALSKQETKCIVITNGVSVHSAPNGTTDYRRALHQELGLGQDTVIFGFFGRFMPQKGFTSLIDAIEALARDRTRIGEFIVLAVNDGAFIREYKALVLEKGLDDYFVFYGFTAEIDRMLLGVDAMVMPSLWEACPLLPMEAFVLGCPVVATACIGLREVIRDTPAVVIKQLHDAGGLVAALREVIQNREKLRQEAAGFIPTARERFDVRKTAVLLDALLFRVAQGK